MKKNGDANNNPVLIIVLGIIFSITGIITLGLMIANGFDSLLLTISLILLPVGIIFIVFGIFRGKKLKSYKALLNNPNAYMTNATFVKSKFSSFSSTTVGVNGMKIPTKFSIYKKIIYTYTDQSGVKQTGKSLLSYTPNQVRYLENKKTFKIKCDGSLSVIIEEIPEQNANYNI